MEINTSHILEFTTKNFPMDSDKIRQTKAALNKAEICKKSIAKYDKEKKKAYVKYPSGKRANV